MTTEGSPELRKELRALLRVARFLNWPIDRLEDEIDKLYRGGVNVQPAPTPDQIAGPA